MRNVFHFSFALKTIAAGGGSSQGAVFVNCVNRRVHLIDSIYLFNNFLGFNFKVTDKSLRSEANFPFDLLTSPIFETYAEM